MKTTNKPKADSASNPKKKTIRKQSAKSDKSDNINEDEQYWEEKFKSNIEQRTSKQTPQELKDYFKAVAQISQEIDKSMKSINGTADSLIKNRVQNHSNHKARTWVYLVNIRQYNLRRLVFKSGLKA